MCLGRAFRKVGAAVKEAKSSLDLMFSPGGERQRMSVS